MQKVKEFLDKDRDLSEIIPDLCKNIPKTVEKLLEMLKEYLYPDPKKPQIPDSEKLTQNIRKIEKLLISVLKAMPSGAHSFDLSEFEGHIQQIVLASWTAFHQVTEPIFLVVKAQIVQVATKAFKTLLKLFGTSALHPKVFKICRSLCTNLKPLKPICSLLHSFLCAVGNSGVELIAEVVEKREILSNTIKKLQVLSCQEKVTLSLCKKNSKKGIGNGHQTRHRKVVMRKTQTKLLKQIGMTTNENLDIEELEYSLRLINLYLQCGPLSQVELDNLFLLPIQRLPETLKYSVVEVMFNYAVLYKKHLKKVKNVLMELLKDVDFRVTCRHFLFILEQVVRIS